MLPFIAGVALGAAAVVAINNNKKIKKALSQGAKKAQDYAQQGYEKSKEIASDIKSSVDEKTECLKSKKVDKSKKSEDSVDDK